MAHIAGQQAVLANSDIKTAYKLIR